MSRFKLIIVAIVASFILFSSTLFIKAYLSVPDDWIRFILVCFIYLLTTFYGAITSPTFLANRGNFFPYALLEIIVLVPILAFSAAFYFKVLPPTENFLPYTIAGVFAATLFLMLFEYILKLWSNRQ
ncbi:MAG: hypothetical protein PHE84_07155 [bacterium]|nr:hypothetical protein [bacterium]